MKPLFLFLLLIASISKVQGQSRSLDSLKYIAENAQQDTNKVMMLLSVSNIYSFFNPDIGLLLAQKALDLARKLHFKKGEVQALNSAGQTLDFMGDYPKDLKLQFDALQINREMKDPAGEAASLGNIGQVYNELGEYRQALQYLVPANKIYQQLQGSFQGSFELCNTGEAYDFLHMRDSALYYLSQAYEKFNPKFYGPHMQSFILRHIGNLYSEIGKKDSALKFYNDVILYSGLTNDLVNMSMSHNKIAELYESVHRYDSSLYHARAAFNIAQSVPLKLQILQASSLLVKLYRETQNTDSAFFYLNIATSLKDSLYGKEKYRQLQLLLLDEQQRQQTIEQKSEQLHNQVKFVSLLSALGVFLLFAFILLRNNRLKQKANSILTEQKEKIEETLSDLKSTQSQLIQSEKMASLGVLTAGIAHEIQNPLNFVNNFSEANTELIDELKTELATGNTQQAIELANDIKENEQKINHHGKRADAIVKGMLQHSQSSTGVKEPTDINKLADEYLRLAYHGLRAKDKDFNAILKTVFDPDSGSVSIIPQNIGRVLLNLYNNAFYAVNEKKKQQGDGYEPTVSVSTKMIGDKVEIKVADNGMGIPQKVLDKIFQPFFTTKPTGQGTGLGLSLSYDIIKADGGELKVETKEGEGSAFIIQLPNS